MNQWVLNFSCEDQPGIVHAIAGAIVKAGGNITELQQFSSTDTGRFFTRIQIECQNELAQLKAELGSVAENLAAKWSIDSTDRPIRTLILASKATHCVNDVLYNTQSGNLNIEIPLILANHPDLKDLAQFYSIPFEEHVVLPENKHLFEDRIRQVVAEHDIELVVLARYMQIISPGLCEELSGRAINIHHSFLPGFKGANPYRQAHGRGVKLIGATAHFVTSDLDEGPIIEQNVARVDHSHSVAELVTIGKRNESATLTEAIRLFSQNRIFLDGNRTVIFR